MKKEYQRVNALTPQEAIDEYEATKRPAGKSATVDPEKVSKIISSMDNRGAWITDISIPHYFGDVFNEPRETIKGIDMSKYLQNMNILIDFILQNKFLQ